MADISLDDLIKKDKEKKKQGGKAAFKTKKPKQEGRNNAKPQRPSKKFQKAPRQLKKTRRDRAPRQDTRPRYEDRPQRSEAPPVSTQGRKLRVRGLHPDVTNDELLKRFMQQGTLEKCRIDQDEFGRSKTTAIVIYHSEDSARNAIQNLNGIKIENSVIAVEYFKRDPSDSRGKVPRQRPIQKGLKKRFDRR